MKEGLYDQVLTKAIANWIDSQDNGAVQTFLESLDPSESALILAAHFRDALIQVLQQFPAERRVEKQIDLVNRLVSSAFDSAEEDLLVSSEARLLQELRRGPVRKATIRPRTPLDQSGLLVNAPREPKLAAELAAELDSADQVDLLCAFVVWTGVRVLREPVKRLAERKVPLRVITTTYMGATEVRALDELAELGADIRVSYDTKSTRLHAKAWMFQRDTGFSTAYIGSSNLSQLRSMTVSNGMSESLKRVSRS